MRSMFLSVYGESWQTSVRSVYAFKAVGQSKVSESNWPRLEFQLHYLLAVWPLACCKPLLNFSFLISNIIFPQYHLKFK